MRTRFFVNPKLQLKNLILILGAVIISFLVATLFINSTVTAAFKDNPIAMAEWMRIKEPLLWGLALILWVLLGIIGLIEYFYFHTIVGPLVALENAIQRMTKGELQDRVQARQGDELVELLTHFDQMRQNLADMTQKQEIRVQKLLSELDAIINSSPAKDILELKNKLKEIRSEMESKAA